VGSSVVLAKGGCCGAARVSGRAASSDVKAKLRMTVELTIVVRLETVSAVVSRPIKVVRKWVVIV
jgi:hypothetical protein